MKDSHLTLRIPADLAKLLGRRAREHGLPKSHLAREAVVRYLAGGPPSSDLPAPASARELAARWPRLAHLAPEEASALSRDIAEARKDLPTPRGAWE